MFVACALLAGCATWSESFLTVEHHLLQSQYPEALAAIERQGGAGSDQVLTLLNKGMVLRMAGDHRASNEAFEAAKALMDELSALSLREQATTFIINDAASSYAGEEHEQVLVHLYEAFNYIALGDLDNARVEALQVDLKLREQAERTQTPQRGADAFARYLTGMIYEDLGEWSDALIAYRKSYEGYRDDRGTAVPLPQALKHDLLRLTDHLGLHDEHDRYRKEFEIDSWTPMHAWRAQGELVLVLHNGLAPAKRERSAATVDPGSGHVVRISLPYYEPRAPFVRSARVLVAEREAQSEVFENVESLARQTLEAKMPAITARALARAVVKAAASKAAREAARKQSNRDDAFAAMLLGLGVEIAGVLTERADTRSWATLPHDIQLARLALPPGSYAVKVELLGSSGHSAGGFEMRDVVIRPGRKTFLSRHWIASQPASGSASGWR